MPSRFEEDPALLTPETAVQVVERFAARERAEDNEPGSSAGLTHVAELAELLGTTPEDVLRLAQESRIAALTQPQERTKSKPLWPLHLGYLTAIGLALGFALTRPPRVIVLPPKVVEAAPAAVVKEVMPPTELRTGFEGLNWQEREIPYAGGGTILPPAGIKVRLAHSWGKPTLRGPEGRTPEGEYAREPLRASIKSLVDTLEKKEVSKYTGRKIDFREVPQGLLNAELPLLEGWHRIEISDGAHFYSGLLPDLRFAKDRGAAQRLLDRETDRLVRQVIKK